MLRAQTEVYYASMPAGVYGQITHTFTPPAEYQAVKWRAYLPQHV